MASDLPNDFDIVILGTGLQESILAAAFSRIGLKVLHIDRNDYYGGPWASFNLQGIEKWHTQHESLYSQSMDSCHFRSLVKEGECLLELPKIGHSVLHPKSMYHVQKQSSKIPERQIPEKDSGEGSQDLDLRIQSQENNKDLLQNAALQHCGENAKSKHKLDMVQTPVKDKEDATGCGSKEGIAAEEITGRDIVDIVDDQFDSASEEDGESGRLTMTDKKGTPPAEIVDPTVTNNKQQSCKEWFADDISKEWRRYSLDLAPRLLYCTGPMVELLIVSDVAKYCEFRTVSRVLTIHDGQLEKVPCSRADVFSSKILSLPEKRLLMKFLTFAVEYKQHTEVYRDYADRPFADFLDSQKLTARIKHFVMQAIAMVSSCASTEQGLASTQKFLQSLGRYGNTAFLFPLYGSGEIPQGFCRLSAVFGGCYCLTLSASHLVIREEDKRCTAVITTGGQRIDCKYLIGDSSYLPADFYIIPEKRTISRGVFVTDATIFPGAEEELSLLYYLQNEERNSAATTVLELPPSAMVCQSSTYLVHMTCSAREDAETDLKPAVSTLFDSHPQRIGDNCAEARGRKPQVLWSLFFQQWDLSEIIATGTQPENVFVVGGPGAEIDPDKHVAQAKMIFKQICPEEEFLPKPPHPDDIIFVDDEETPALGNRSSGLTANPEATEEGSEFREMQQVQEHSEVDAAAVDFVECDPGGQLKADQMQEQENRKVTVRKDSLETRNLGQS